MAGAGVGERAGAGAVLAEPQRRELLGARPLDEGVQADQDRHRAVSFPRVRPGGCPKAAHRLERDRAVAGNVADEQREQVGAQRQHVVEVPSDGLGPSPAGT